MVSPRTQGGFTLIELVVVMALTAVMMGLALPSFRNLMEDETRRSSQWMLLQIPRLKAAAVSEGKTQVLHVDLDHNRLWVSRVGMSPEELSRAETQGLALSDACRLTGVVLDDGSTTDSGDVPIYFYPKGYSSRAIVHMEGDGSRRSLIVEPFLNQAEMKESYVLFEG